MTEDQLIDEAGRLKQLLDQPSEALKPAVLAHCLAGLSMAAEDDDIAVQASFFAALSPDLRKLALMGLIAIVTAGLRE